MTRAKVRWVAPLAAVGAGGAFWILSGGGALSPMVSGFADVTDHPVAPLQAGRVARVVTRVGQAVRVGEAVAVMDTRELDLRVRAARAALAQSEAALVAEDIDARAAVARAELLVLKTQTSATRDRAQLVEVRQQLARLQKLAAEKLVQAQDVERARLLEAQLSASVEMYDTANKEHQAGLGRSMRENVTNQQVARRLEPLREAVHQKEAALRMAELALAEATLRAPVDGTVSLIVHHEGDTVPAATEIVRVTSARPGVVVCWLPEKMAERVAVGATAELRRTGFLAKAFPGEVEGLAPEIEEVPVRARVSSTLPAWGRRLVIASTPDRPLLPGEAIRVRFRDQGRATLAMRAPAGAVAAARPHEPEPTAARAPEPAPSADSPVADAAVVPPEPTPARAPSAAGAAAAPVGAVPSAIVVPPTLAAGVATLEPSGIAWSAPLDRYLIVSDDTGPTNDHHRPWLLAMSRDGVFDEAPVPLAGLESLNDAEAIAAGPDDTFFIATSHSPNKRGRTGGARRMLLWARLDGRTLRVIGRVDLTTARDEAGRGLLEIAGLPAGGRLDIEGITYVGGALLVGLKSPLTATGAAVILRLASAAEALQRGAIPAGAVTKLAEIPLDGGGGAQRGISDLMALPDGSLIVLANAPKQLPSDGGGAAFWIPAAEPRTPRQLRRFEGLRPEGVTLAPDGASLVVVFDTHDKAPLWARMPVPHRSREAL